MERVINKVDRKMSIALAPKRVAAYTRVSSGKDAMLHSLSAQVSYYSEMIQRHPGWDFCGVYSDEALTGTKEDRAGFQQMLNDCRSGKIDCVITKSISRFARNTVTLLQTVRELKELGVDVFFEEQNIHTMSADGELLLTILASYAQEESRSASENQLWRIRTNFKDGKPWSGKIMGYRYDHGTYVVVPEEAEIIKRIFADYLAGYGVQSITNRLNKNGVKTRRGYNWSRTGVLTILRNYAYTGNLLLQKTYRENHLNKKRCINRGEHPMYHVEGSHEPIIPLEQFLAVQEEFKRRSSKYLSCENAPTPHMFTGMIVCSICGKNYRRRTTPTGKFWVCSTYNTKGKAACPSHQVPESVLYSATAEIVGVDNPETEVVRSIVKFIRVEENHTLVFCLADGSEKVKHWDARSRAESWTPEMRERARTQYIQRRNEEEIK